MNSPAEEATRLVRTGRAGFEAGDLPAALSAFTQAAELFPCHAPVLQALATVRQAAGSGWSVESTTGPD